MGKIKEVVITVEEDKKEFGLRLSEAIRGKTVKSFAFNVIKSKGDCIDDKFIIIDFTDGKQLKIEYQHIYTIELCTKE